MCGKKSSLQVVRSLKTTTLPSHIQLWGQTALRSKFGKCKECFVIPVCLLWRVSVTVNRHLQQQDFGQEFILSSLIHFSESKWNSSSSACSRDHKLQHILVTPENMGLSFNQGQSLMMKRTSSSPVYPLGHVMIITHQRPLNQPLAWRRPLLLASGGIGSQFEASGCNSWLNSWWGVKASPPAWKGDFMAGLEAARSEISRGLEAMDGSQVSGS